MKEADVVYRVFTERGGIADAEAAGHRVTSTHVSAEPNQEHDRQ